MSRSSAVTVVSVVAVAGLVALGAAVVGEPGGGIRSDGATPVAAAGEDGSTGSRGVGRGAEAGAAAVEGVGGSGVRGAGGPGAAGARSSPDGPAAHPWRWPLAPRPAVLRRFRAPPDPYAAGHRGLDLGTSVGDVVLAVADGVVTHSGTVAGRGTVTVLHLGGLRSTYEPVDPSVHRGDVVVGGAPIGVVATGVGQASGHCGARACLHLGARWGEAYVDPWPLLAGGRLALLPLG